MIFDLNYMRTLIEESDRGCVLLATTELDKMLEALHRAHIDYCAKPPAKVVNKLFEWPNPLSSLAAKIQFAYVYGLIDEGTFKSLERLRKFRNTAAHSSEPLNLLERTREVMAIGSAIPTFREIANAVTKEQLQSVDSMSEHARAKVAFLSIAMALGIQILKRQTGILSKAVERERAKWSKTDT